MCGFLFVKSAYKFEPAKYNKYINNISWRGPDAQSQIIDMDKRVFLGHCRLAIIDSSPVANQPMTSECGRYSIIFNGEIYNHIEIRNLLGLNCKTKSDTETLLNAYIKLKSKALDYLNGMYSFVIWDNKENAYFAARDQLGVKPMYYHINNETVIFSSEAHVIAAIINSSHSAISIQEWKTLRRPTPGNSFFEYVSELLPGHFLDNSCAPIKYWEPQPSNELFNQEKIESLIKTSIDSHLLSDAKIVSLLSGGIDSSLITKISNVRKAYTVGLPEQNEFDEATKIAQTIEINLQNVIIKPEDLIESWRSLTKLRNEPLSLPNEGLIFLVCKNMHESEKVVLTGEGADEVFFGYENLYRWAANDGNFSIEDFLKRYSYNSGINHTERFINYLDKLSLNKKPIEFVEDFFINFHLPGLLRRMDFASMAASKEARVPFVNPIIVNYMYRRKTEIKLDDKYSKIPLREICKKNAIFTPLSTPKIGFSARLNKKQTQDCSYKFFQEIVEGELK